ncbi:hypothetical protein [Helicobacter sp.]|nr:hypothetical protein [Helicobacter sp.]MBD5165324.1 hypothetical protein [Helicobacter sp.]
MDQWNQLNLQCMQSYGLPQPFYKGFAMTQVANSALPRNDMIENAI